MSIEWTPERLGRELRAQDNRMTSNPIFIVQDRRRGRTSWHFVTACLTEQGCKDYIAANGHNLHDARIYVESGYRNEEWEWLRKHFMAQAENAKAMDRVASPEAPPSVPKPADPVH